MIILFILYGGAMIGMSIWLRQHRTGDEYLMADRRASAFLVGAALFTLVGGGELVTMPALAYTFGLAGLALFVGYALGFAFLGVIVPRVRKQVSEHLYLSLPDFVYANFGRLAGGLTFGISFLAFFALLLIQFTAGGQIIHSLSGIGYIPAIVLTGGIATIYLFIGGFRTVLATDVVQGFARFLLVPLLTIVAFSGIGHATAARTVQSLPIDVWISLTVTGFFTAAASADVWQRIYAAKSDRAARMGLFGGAGMLMLFGGALVALGIVARQSALITTPDAAFTGALSLLLPRWAVTLAVVLVLSTIMSTADTELFLLSGMLHREFIRLRGVLAPREIARNESTSDIRFLIFIIFCAAAGLAFVFRELISIYTWLLSAILVMSPMILASLFVKPRSTVANLSLILNLVIFVVLAITGDLTPTNAYLIVIPGLVVYVVSYFLLRGRDVTAAKTGLSSEK
jgi:Na+/proline symporter